ncbi:MAG: sirohydrochlorin cobaltochelatase [Desulfovibrio sp.]|nr:sirohydrochlorin cobaltochelatase [Desulfovibrio sp.]
MNPPEALRAVRRVGILLVAYGVAAPAGDKALELFTRRVRGEFPDCPARWAFTSDLLRGRLAAAGKKTDSVYKALMRMAFERYSHVAVQSLHLISGEEYEALCGEVDKARAGGGPERISLGFPLLHGGEDVAAAAAALLAHLPAEREAGEPVVFVGHGGRQDRAYAALEHAAAARDGGILIGTLSRDGEAEKIIERLRVLCPPKSADAGGRRVWLLPLLALIGKHAVEDIAGENSRSWRGRIEAAGFSCRVLLRGTVECDGFARIWLNHLRIALEELR